MQGTGHPWGHFILDCYICSRRTIGHFVVVWQVQYNTFIFVVCAVQCCQRRTISAVFCSSLLKFASARHREMDAVGTQFGAVHCVCGKSSFTRSRCVSQSAELSVLCARLDVDLYRAVPARMRSPAAMRLVSAPWTEEGRRKTGNAIARPQESTGLNRRVISLFVYLCFPLPPISASVPCLGSGACSLVLFLAVHTIKEFPFGDSWGHQWDYKAELLQAL